MLKDLRHGKTEKLREGEGEEKSKGDGSIYLLPVMALFGQR